MVSDYAFMLRNLEINWNGSAEQPINSPFSQHTVVFDPWLARSFHDGH